MASMDSDSESRASLTNSGAKYTPEQTAENIKNIAKAIRDSSARLKETVRTLRESGAIEEIGEAIREASAAARDTAKEISETAKDLKERGVISDTAGAVEETTRIAQDTVQSVRDTANEAASAAPQTAEAVRKGVETVKMKSIETKDKTKKESERMMKKKK